MAESGPRSPVRRLGAALIALGRIRLELAALDWQDEKARLSKLLVAALLAALLAGFALIALAITLTVALWDTPWRLAALVVATLALGAGAAFAAWRVAALSHRDAAPFATTRRELARDEATLRGEPGP